jgi:hypothetical protein
MRQSSAESESVSVFPAAATRALRNSALALLLLLVMLLLSGCSPAKPASAAVYAASLTPLNSSVTGQPVAGTVQFAVAGDQLVISVDASDVPAGMEHWQHVHGFTDGRAAACPTMAADANGDSLVDLIETEALSGTTMIPLHRDPVSMDIPQHTYPVATAGGTLAYADTVSLAALQQAFDTTYPGQQLDLDHRVVFLHGVPASTQLPASVASLGPIPAQVTLPIACGVLSLVHPVAD